jgi:hypothetical protein
MMPITFIKSLISIRKDNNTIVKPVDKDIGFIILEKCLYVVIGIKTYLTLYLGNKYGVNYFGSLRSILIISKRLEVCS